LIFQLIKNEAVIGSIHPVLKNFLPKAILLVDNITRNNDRRYWRIRQYEKGTVNQSGRQVVLCLRMLAHPLCSAGIKCSQNFPVPQHLY